MDLGIVLQAGASAAQTAQAIAASGVTAADVSTGSAISYALTNFFRGLYGGSLEKNPRNWMLVACAFGCGVIGIAIAFAMRGINPFDGQWLANALGFGLTASGPGAVAMDQTAKVVRPRPPVVPEPAGIPSVSPVVSPAFPPEVVAAADPPAAEPPPDLPPEPAPHVQDDPRAAILEAAPRFVGIPYRLDPPPDGIHTLDCSFYVLKVLEAAGLPLAGVRTAEQIRQACVPVAWADVLPGDLLFFEHTYPARGPAGPDGKIASHIAISLGAGTLKAWDHNDTRGTAGILNLGTPYWQEHIFEARRIPALVGHQPAGSGTDVVHAIDVSNHQTRDVSGYLAKTGATHVIVKCYQTIEVAGGREHAKAQLASALANGASVGGYVWLYHGVPVANQVADALSLAAEAGVTLPILWIDVEPYTDGGLPTVAEIREALAACAQHGMRAGIYTDAWVWQRLGHPQFPGVPLWYAHYTGVPDLSAPGFGAMRVVGHQYDHKAPDGSPLDVNVFLPEVTQ